MINNLLNLFLYSQVNINTMQIKYSIIGTIAVNSLHLNKGENHKK